MAPLTKAFSGEGDPLHLRKCARPALEEWIEDERLFGDGVGARAAPGGRHGRHYGGVASLVVVIVGRRGLTLLPLLLRGQLGRRQRRLGRAAPAAGGERQDDQAGNEQGAAGGQKGRT